jgi:hypothetical protein
LLIIVEEVVVSVKIALLPNPLPAAFLMAVKGDQMELFFPLGTSHTHLQVTIESLSHIAL